MTPEQLMPHLPHLRRYARLLTGEQPAGDAVVERMLKRMLQDRRNGEFPQHSVRCELYRSLLDVIAEIRHRQPPAVPPRDAIDAGLMAMKPLAREVFLLVTVEEFSLQEAAVVLQMTPADVARQLEEAGREIERQMATTVLVIEDEPLIALDLESIVAGMGHSLVGVAATKSEAISLMRETRPGLILADIQLADGSSGLDAVREIMSIQVTPSVFITAFPERLLTGGKPEPAFLITKPFQADQVKAIISQTLFLHRRQQPI